MSIIDITQPLSEGMPVWPGDTPVTIARGEEMPAVSTLHMSSHTGTHVDAPAHLIAGGATVDRLSLDDLVGMAWVAHVTGPGPVTAPMLARAGIPIGPVRILLRTDNSNSLPAMFDPDFVGLAPDAAAWLLGRGIRLVGIDGPSIEPFDSPGEPVHHALLGAGVIVVEGLVLADVSPGAYQLACLPLKVAGGDGAPARAVLLEPAGPLNSEGDIS